MAAPEVSPGRVRGIVAAAIVIALAVGLWRWIEARSAAPPPPQIALPAP